MSVKRRDNLKKWLPALFGLLTLALSSSCAVTSKDKGSSDQNDLSLEEYLEKGGEKWFLTGIYSAGYDGFEGDIFSQRAGSDRLYCE